MSLCAEFARYLRDRSAKDALVAALGDRVEAQLLARWEGGRLKTEWSGRTAWVGTTVPPLAQRGDLWLDATEVTPMVLITRVENDEPFAWMATRPAERWQLAGFQTVARDSFGARLDGDEREPVTNIKREEAWRYAGWFGKGLFDRVGWQLAAEVFAPAEIAALWEPIREWDGEVYEGVYSDVAPDTVDDTPIEDDHYPWLYNEGTASAAVGFRTEVHLQLGLRRTRAQRDTEPVEPRPLTDALVAFLRTGATPDLGDRLEGQLLREGRTTPDAGVWLDPRDLTPMRGAIALRPVERWQFGAFLAITGYPAKPTRGYTDLFDRTRLLARPETEPLTRVLREEASLYAHWAGKRVAGREPREWSSIREWAEEVAPGVFAVVGPDTVDREPVLPGKDQLRSRYQLHDTYPDWDTVDDVGFRTITRQ
jgi:hypothetical protein